MPACFQRLANVPYHGDIFGWIFEISEARKQIENVVKRIGPERLAHVLSMKVKVRILTLLRPADAFGREIESGDVETHRSQVSGMAPSATPRSSIDEPPAGW